MLKLRSREAEARPLCRCACGGPSSDRLTGAASTASICCSEPGPDSLGGVPASRGAERPCSAGEAGASSPALGLTPTPTDAAMGAKGRSRAPPPLMLRRRCDAGRRCGVPTLPVGAAPTPGAPKGEAAPRAKAATAGAAPGDAFGAAAAPLTAAPLAPTPPMPALPYCREGNPAATPVCTGWASDSAGSPRPMLAAAPSEPVAPVWPKEVPAGDGVVVAAAGTAEAEERPEMLPCAAVGDVEEVGPAARAACSTPADAGSDVELASAPAGPVRPPGQPAVVRV